MLFPRENSIQISAGEHRSVSQVPTSSGGYTFHIFKGAGRSSMSEKGKNTESDHALHAHFAYNH